MQASRIDQHASSGLISRRMYFTLSINQTHEDLFIVADFQLFTVHHLKTILHVNECHVTIVTIFSFLGGHCRYMAI